MYSSGGTIQLLSTSSLRYLGKRIGLSSTVERVPALYNVSQSQHYSTILFQPRLTTSRLRRTYAQKFVSRSATTAAKKAPTTSATKAAKKPAPKKTTPKSLPKAKAEAKPVKKKTKAKTKAKTKVKKPKTKVKKPKAKKPKKVLTAEEKTKATIKDLKAKALKPPAQLATLVWQVFLKDKVKAMEKVQGEKGAYKKQFATTSKAASAAYKELTPEQLENYNHLTTQNKNANAAAYRQFIESHTPLEIYNANLARRHLTRLGVRSSQLKDDRQVTSSRSAYIYFYQSRYKSGDFRGMKSDVAAGLIGREWKGQTDEQKKPFIDMAAQDLARYSQERKTVLNKEMRSPKPKKLTA